MLVAVPNIKELAQGWINGKVNNFIFLVNTYGAYQGYVEDTHKWGFDFTELRDRLSGWNGTNNELQWSQIREIGASEFTSSPLYKGADVAFDWWILVVEFTK